ncbi:hypothetical protein [Micromonospora sp. 4G55]|uniref:hypothetical protein n=1 Tax=Micromonospora sp. 4G55 TaxID=2806102 RepID=UPI001A42D6D1|nr:hypothetical protein [Micromonospora sp. 4G55]MBM0259896.1 hypothetical protein [Micromonospora sp. 4G55]
MAGAVRWRSRPIRVAAAGTAVVLALAAAGYGGRLYVDRRQAVEVAEAKAVLVAYLERVRNEDSHGAYLLLCSDVLDSYPEAQHEEFLRNQPPLASFRLGEPERRSSLKGTFLVYGVRLTSTDGASKVSGFAVALYSDRDPLVCDAPDWRSEWVSD